jgi:predicted DNA-binding protein with PD1-like motif
MDAKLIHEEAGALTFVLVFATGDEAHAGLSRFARAHELAAAHFTGIGAFSDVVLGYFDWQAKDYKPIRIEEQVEVVALIGDVALDEGQPSVHAHVVVAGADGHARGGHLLEGHVRPTLEVVLSESPAHLRKRYDPGSGLALIALDAGPGSGLPQGEANLPAVPGADANVVGRQAQRLVEEESATPRGASEEGGGLEP